MNIRKGKDITIRWGILTNGEPASLEGRNLSLFIRCPHADLLPHDFEIEGNTIVFDFRASEQKYLGPYGCTLYENYGLEGQTVVDICHAFTLVATTCQESAGGNCACENVETETVDLGSSDLNIGLRGPKGDPGFSPIIEPDKDNTDDTYRLHIITADDEFTTPNLYGGGNTSNYDDTELRNEINGLKTSVGEKVDKVPGMGLSEQNFTSELKSKLESLNNYDDSTISAAVTAVQRELDTLLNGDVNGVIDSFNEMEAFLQGITEAQTLTGLLADLKAAIVALIPSLEGYATQVWVEGKGYQTTTDADGKYQPKGDYALKSEIPSTDGLLSKTEADKAYQPAGSYATKSDISDMETKTDAANTYQTKTDAANDLAAAKSYADNAISEVDNKVADMFDENVPIPDGAARLQRTEPTEDGKQAAYVDLSGKQDKLTAGRGIDIDENGEISSTLDVNIFTVVKALPQGENIDTNKIYLIQNADAVKPNIYTEYAYINGAWEILGEYKSDVDLTPYLTKTDAANTYQPRGSYATTQELSAYAKKGEVDAKTLGGSSLGNKNGDIVRYTPFPDYRTIVELGYNKTETQTDNEQYLKGLCRWAINNYATSSDQNLTLFGDVCPSSHGFCILTLYSGLGKDGDNLPKYCVGFACLLTGTLVSFGTTNFVWFYKRVTSTTATTTTSASAVIADTDIDRIQKLENAVTKLSTRLDAIERPMIENQ